MGANVRGGRGYCLLGLTDYGGDTNGVGNVAGLVRVLGVVLNKPTQRVMSTLLLQSNERFLD
jgi:hypothetical protein